MSQAPRGLTVFISDLRSCPNKEAEQKRINKELGNIRAKFLERTDGYSKKKYISKLVYMYMLGYDIDFGHVEALHLLSSTKFTEKFMGYLACSVLLNETHEFLKLIVNSVHQDLVSRSENGQCLALTCIATISNKEMAEALFSPVMTLLLDSGTRPWVKKKAALCILKFHRKGAGDLSSVDNLCDRLAQLLDDKDLGVPLSVMSLVLGIVSRNPRGLEPLVPRMVKLLQKIVLEKFGQNEHAYYSVPSPWLTVKLLRALQHMELPAEDRLLRSGLIGVLSRIFTTTIGSAGASGGPKAGASQVHNASHAVLFEAMNLIIHIVAAGGVIEGDLLSQTSTLLGRFIGPKETSNVRYCGLEAMSHLVQGLHSADLIRPHQDTIMLHLKDPDISIRRRALDLVYKMCDKSNATAVTSELLLYLKDAEVAIRPELVLKIAILAEKFAPDYSWYVDQILHLISLAGDHVSDDIWFRVVHIVTNNEPLQRYSAETVFGELSKPHVHENMLKVGGYLLGEFGSSVAHLPGTGPQAQFHALHRNFSTAQPRTKALLLTAYVKMAFNHPELLGPVRAVFDAHKGVVDVEIQQRASEYSELLSQVNSGVAPVVLDMMPVFPPRENSLLKRLETAEAVAADPRNRSLSTAAQPGADEGAVAPVAVAATAAPAAGPARAIPPQASSSLIDASDDEVAPPMPSRPLNDDMVVSRVASDLDLLTAVMGGGAAPSEPPAPSASASAEPGEVSVAQLKAWFDRLCQVADGVIYEDASVQIGIKSEYTGARGRMGLFFGNKTGSSLTNVTASVAAVPELRVQATSLPAEVEAGRQSQQVLQVECATPFALPPAFRLTFTTSPSAHPRVITLKLPLHVFKFTRPLPALGPEFMAQWRELAGAPREVQGVVKSAVGLADLAPVKAHLLRLNLASLEGVDPNPANLVCAGVFTAVPPSGEVSVNILARLETNVAQQMIRITVRTKSAALSAAAHAVITTQLGAV